MRLLVIIIAVLGLSLSTSKARFTDVTEGSGESSHHQPFLDKIDRYSQSTSKNYTKYEKDQSLINEFSTMATNTTTMMTTTATVVPTLPPELKWYLQYLQIIVEQPLREEFSIIRSSLPPVDDGASMDQPRSRLICSTADYEVRLIRASWWASTRVYTSSFDVAIYIGFHRLYRYIRGYNVEGITIPMTKPVRIGVSRNGQNSFTVTFYLFNHHRHRLGYHSPTPLDNRIMILGESASYYFVRKFDGFPISSRVAEQAEFLRQQLLTRFNESIVGEGYFVNVYDSPLKATDRHNEILIRLPDIRKPIDPGKWCPKVHSDIDDMNSNSSIHNELWTTGTGTQYSDG